jgi:hypothetical protein
MKNLNDLVKVDNPSVLTEISHVTQHVTQNMTQKVTQTSNGVTMTSNGVTLSENNNQFIFSSAMYQTMPARHSSARSRDRDKVSFTFIV